MNLPNRLTMFRIILVPVMVMFLLVPGIPCGEYGGLIVFAIASVTDFFDGFLARKYNLITNFGKFTDPLADKLLVCSAMICFVGTGKMPAWVALILIAREFIISGIRLLAAEQGKVIAANLWGKVKTFVQMVMILWMFLPVSHPVYQGILWGFMIVSVLLTLISLVIYIWDNKEVFQEEEALKKNQNAITDQNAITNEHAATKENFITEEALVKTLTKKHATITTAESCTGGLLCASLVNISGASAVLKKGFITYANEAKEKELGVSSDTLERFGAVSRECAMEMAKGAAQRAEADLAISTTGIAGPEGGTREKPVGLVYIGIYYLGDVFAKECHFQGDRMEVRSQTVQKALVLANETLMNSRS